MVVLFFALLGMAANPARVHAEDIEVECLDPGGQELIDAITRANNNGEPDTINLGPGCVIIKLDSAYAGSESAFPEITSVITINGNGATLQRNADSAEYFRIFKVASNGNLTLNQVTLKGGVAVNGGAIFNHGGSLTVSNSTISGNETYRYGGGGGIFNLQGTLTVSDSIISDNWADSGSAIDNQQGTLTVSNSTISNNNNKVSEAGGGISNSGTLTVTNCTISGNTKAKQGGGILNYGTLIVSNSTISGTVAAENGGGIYNYGTVTVSNSTISGNSASREGGRGGGIYNNGGTLMVSHSTISGNSASQVGGRGGGIYNNDGTLMVSHSTISGNSASRQLSQRLGIDNGGGGIYNDGGTVEVSDSTISGNQASVKAVDGGGGISNSGTLTVTNCTISDNRAHQGGGIHNRGTLMVSHSTIGSGNRGFYTGGGIYNDGGTLEVTNSTISGNSTRQGGGILNTGTATLQFTTVYTNHAASAAGISNFGNMELEHTILAGNYRPSGRGDDCSGDITPTGPNLIEHDEDCAISGDKSLVTTGTPANLGPLQDNGGPTWTHAPLPGSPVIDAGSATPGDPTTDQRGEDRLAGDNPDLGAVELAPRCFAIVDDGTTVFESVDVSAVQYAIDKAEDGDTVKVAGICQGLSGLSGQTEVSAININKDLTLQGGYTPDDWLSPDLADPTLLDAAGQGRVVVILAGGHTVTLDGLVITNGAAETGAGIANYGGALTVSNSIVEKNLAGKNGGAIYNAGGTLTVSDSTISGNETAGSGGGIYNPGGTLTVSSSTIITNEARYVGGGIYNAGTLTVSSSTIITNETRTRGGGIYNMIGKLTVSNSTISGNEAAESGGGICNAFRNSTLTVTDSTISSNKAVESGGGIALLNGSLTLDGVEVRDNSAPTGGGVYVADVGTLTVTRSTVYHNQATEGGGVYNNGGQISLANTTISGNQAGSGGGISAGGGATDIHFTTIAFNRASQGANVNHTDGDVNLFATIVAQPKDGPNCSGLPLTSIEKGYNVISDGSCALQAEYDTVDASDISLGDLKDNGGPTPTHKPEIDSPVVDSVTQPCLGVKDTDQRGRPRPRVGRREEGVSLPPPDTWRCDAGAVELGEEIHRVCGAPLSPTDEADSDWNNLQCKYTSLQDALDKAQRDDSIVIAGVITERVTVAKSVTIRGPLEGEITPQVHMGVVQASAQAPGDGAGWGSVFTIEPITQPITVTIQHLNIRHGAAVQGGGIFNQGNLRLDSVTLYDNRAADQGGAVYHAGGTLRIINSTLVSNTADAGGAIYQTGSTLEVEYATLADNRGGNLAHTSGLVITPTHSIDIEEASGRLGPLRDNGGPTLTRIPLDRSFVDQAACEGDLTDQRGRARSQGGDRCDLGAVEVAPVRLTLCQDCERDVAGGRYTDLQEALDRALAGDTIAIQAGAYTGNFIAYKDVTLQHAGIDVAALGREQATDVRAILQASERSIREQHRLGGDLPGTVLTIQGYAPLAASDPITPSGDVSVTLRGLTIRHGMSQKGGGIYNLGTLHTFTSTIEGNAAVNGQELAQGGAIYSRGSITLTRSTLSGNQSEYYGGGIYVEGESKDDPALVNATASTIADNRAERFGKQHVVVIDNDLSGTGQISFTQAINQVVSGDEIFFQNKLPIEFDLVVAGDGSGIGCNTDRLELRAVSLSSSFLRCTVDDNTNHVITLSKRGEDIVSTAITVTSPPPDVQPQAHSIYAGKHSQVKLARSIVVNDNNSGRNCVSPGAGDLEPNVNSDDYNWVSDTSCNLTRDGDVRPIPGQEFPHIGLGPLQDNNSTDFQNNRLSGYTYSHALLPDSPAIDRIPLDRCEAARKTSIPIRSGEHETIAVGDIVSWGPNTEGTDYTVVLNDGEHDVRLITLPAGGSTEEVQFTEADVYRYRVYSQISLLAQNILGEPLTGTITVTDRRQAVDQRGLPLPQRGPTGGQYRCDIGAYEFQPWLVGQPLPRPPAAIGTQPPSWEIDGSSVDGVIPAHHVWSAATAQDWVLRPPSQRDGEQQMVSVIWKTDPNPASEASLSQVGVAIWPDDPQLHISGARVDLNHQAVSDGFQASSAQAYVGSESVGQILPVGVFSRTLTSKDGAYSVLQFVQSNQVNGAIKVQVVKTVDWNTPGIRDMRSEASTCTIGTHLDYEFINAAGETVRHQDPEGKAGQILQGTAFDGVRSAAELAIVQNTVDGLVPPAHVRETREGPIIPITGTVSTRFGDTDLEDDKHDLRVAWYRPDARNVAWPVKTVGYRCAWPEDPDRIVIASELGSEIGGQPLLSPDRYADVTVYHQPLTTTMGYSPNYEHALLAASNLGNIAPALYALRTDLHDRDTAESGIQSYALLKYRDPQHNNEPRIDVYRVVLTDTATTITPTVELGGGSQVDGRFTVPVEVVGAQNLRSVTVHLAYSSTLTPTLCEPNHLKFVEAPAGLQVQSNAPVRAGRVVRLRADLEAGTNVRFEWDFGAGTQRIAGPQVSTVYDDEKPGEYTVTVTATNGLFAPITATKRVRVIPKEDTKTPVDLPLEEAGVTGCRHVPGAKKLVLELKSRDKQGLSGDLALAELTFDADPTGQLKVEKVEGYGPDYRALRFDITAGNPVYAPTPLRGLLDIQPCDGTKALDTAAVPFWKDYKGGLWARAAGHMEVQYFYPLQPGFYLEDEHAREMGLLQVAQAGQTKQDVLSEDERVGRCVPWLDQLSDQPNYTGFPDKEKETYVLPVAYNVSWPDLPALLTVGETVYERAKGGVSGVANQMAVTRIYDDEAPGKWDNDATKIVISGRQAIKSLAQLIDPVGEVRVELPVEIEDNPSLPEEIQSERLLFGGGQAIVGNKENLDLALPFSLRSRITFDETPQDLDGDGKTNGTLVFRGYYDGTSPEYIKGDPLLLLNVMSESDKARLRALCPDGGEAYPFDDSDCGKYKKAIEDLFHKTRNPRQLDLCRTSDGKLGPDGSKDARYADDAPADASSGKEDLPCPKGGNRDGLPDWDLLIGVQDVNNDGQPEPYEGLGKGKALTAGNAAGTGYITLAYNNDPSLGGLPVSLQVIHVGCTLNHLGEDSTYRGNLLTIQSDNLFDEKLTLRHTGDFGGQPDNFEFEWYVAAVDDTGVSPATLPPTYPWTQWTAAGANGPEITIEGANPTTLRDNWFIMRYRGYPVCGNQVRYSAFAGDPSAKPSEVRAQLAEGWVKRVTNALNPFDARVDDFVSSPVNTTVDMISQAGPRYEGPIAFSSDPEVLNQLGLIESYETVLDRGRTLSIDSDINDQGANAALLNVTSRIADLYLLLANDAYMDALDPTVGLGTDSALGSRAPTLFAFMNQFRAGSFGLIDEELALLRGRDETLGGVAAAPTYNRLTWNFSNGDGEVAYVQNYNIKDANQDGYVDEADAALRYPQGHGDAWGHYLTAIGRYYELLRHPSYTWVPRAEPLSVAGAPLVVDYYDERRLAIAAAAKARLGAEIVDLTYRQHYADPDSQPYVDDYIDPSDQCHTVRGAVADCNRRAWGVADWARRAGQGAYLDWVAVNAILPPEDERYQDLRKIDRSTVLEIGEIADYYDAIQQQLDNADNDLNPLGLAQDVVLFDLDPALVAQGETHFEQVYQRALTNLDITASFFDYANQMKLAQREAHNERRDFVASIIDQDTALINELIELFGYPYDADIGVNGTYPEGYEGPDIYNYDLYDRVELTDAQKRCTETDWANSDPRACPPKTTTYLVEYPAIDCLGNFVQPLALEPRDTVVRGDLCQVVGYAISVKHTVGIGLDAGRGRFKPASWPEGSARKAPGEIQNTLQALTQARLEYEMAIRAYKNHVEKMDGFQKAIKDKAQVLENKTYVMESRKYSILAIDTAILIAREIAVGLDESAKIAKETTQSLSICPPLAAGFSNDVTSAVRCGIRTSGLALVGPMSTAAAVADAVSFAGEIAKDTLQIEQEMELFKEDADYELRQLGRDMGALLREERELRLALFLAKDQVNSAQGTYDQTLQRAFRTLRELIRLRQRWAGQISEQRYGDMAYRKFQIDALQKYRQQFDLAQQYVYLTAAAYDYETNLADDDPAAGERFRRQIVGLRSLGELVQQARQDGTVIPIPGLPGLADPLARMADNFAVLKGQMGFNNPQDEANQFSLRRELFNLRPGSDTGWQDELARFRMDNIYENDVVARLAKRPYGVSDLEPGLVITMSTIISEGLNFFGQPLGPGDSAYDATQSATKIAAVGIQFDGYDTQRLASTPRVYLIPAGDDMTRPRNSSGTPHRWTVTEQLLPIPYPVSQADLENPNWIPRIDGLSGQLYQIKPYSRLRAYPGGDGFSAEDLNTDTRLIGRSVWNTEWLLVIPGSSLLADPQEGLELFLEDVKDIKLYFKTYSYAGGR
jgi:hypothetical protein